MSYDKEFQNAMQTQQQIKEQVAPESKEVTDYDSAFQAAMPQSQQPVEPPIPPEKQKGAFMSAVEGWNRSIGRTVEGVLQLASPILPDSFNKELKRVNQGNELSYDEAVKQHPVASRVGELAGYAAQEYPLPMPYTGGLLTRGITKLLGEKIAKNVATDVAIKAGTFGATGGALMGSQYGSQDQRLERAKYGAEMSALFGAGGELAFRGMSRLLSPSTRSGFLSQVAPFTPKRAATKDIMTDISEAGGAPAVAKGTIPAENLGVSLTPAEALGNPSMLSKLGKLDISESGISNVNKFLSERTGKMQGEVKKMIDNFIPEGADVAKSTKTQLYKSLEGLQTDSDTFAGLTQNPVIMSELDNLKGNIRLPKTLREMPNNSVLKLDQVKKEIDTQLYNNKSFLGNQEKTLGPAERNALTEARTQIVDTLDGIFPQYAPARKVAERIALKQQMTDEISKIKLRPNTNEPTLNQMYDRLWGTSEKQQNFLSAVERAGSDPIHAQDVLTVLNQIRKSPLEDLAKKSMYGKSVDIDLAQMITNTTGFLSRVAKGRYNDAILKLSLSGDKWKSEFQRAISKSSHLGEILSIKKLLDRVGQAKMATMAHRASVGAVPQAYTDTFLEPEGDSRIDRH